MNNAFARYLENPTKPLVPFALPVEITRAELFEWGSSGIEMAVDDWKAKYEPGKKRKPEYRIANGFLGGVGQGTLCKFCGIKFIGVAHEYRHPDCGTRTEVRTSTHLHAGLNVFRKDARDRMYVLVVGGPFLWWIVGWAYGSEVQQEKYLEVEPLRESGHYFRMPQVDQNTGKALLRPFELKQLHL